MVATEQPFTVTCRLPDESVVVLRGTADRLELDNEGRLVVVDLKTGKYPAEKIAEHPQLGLYQLAVAEGGFAEVAGRAASRAGPNCGNCVRSRADFSRSSRNRLPKPTKRAGSRSSDCWPRRPEFSGLSGCRPDRASSVSVALSTRSVLPPVGGRCSSEPGAEVSGVLQ